MRKHPITEITKITKTANSVLALGLLLISCAVAAADPTPSSMGRIARLSNVEGGVQVLRGTTAAFQQALMNMPLTEGSRLVTSNDGRAEVQFEDGSIARITPNSSLSINVLQRNSDESIVTEVELLSGLGYFELRPAAGQQADAVRFGANLLTTGTGTVLRVNRDADPGEVAVLSGDAHVAGGTLFNVDVHSNETIRFDTSDPTRYYLGQSAAGETWDQWNADRDQALAQAAAQETSVAAQHGDPDNPAWSDLDTSGSWYSIPGYGDVWTPAGAGPGWDPYGYGYWAYYPGQGYVWVSGYSWGWLPYRCGGWNYFDSFGWGWLPGNCGYGFGSGGGAGWDSEIVIYSPPRGYIPPARPVLKGQPTRLVSNQRVIAVDRGPHARVNPPVTIAGGNTPPKPVVYQGQRLEPISAKDNPGRGSMRGTALRQEGMAGAAFGTSGSAPSTTPVESGPWFTQGHLSGGARSGTHEAPVQSGPPSGSRPPNGSSVYQPPPWAMPQRPSGGQAPEFRPAPAAPHYSAPSAPAAPVAPHYSAPPAPAAPASHPSSAPASSSPSSSSGANKR